ncbi:MAG TPA: heme biosynthesis protein HemY, partial [Caulobacteraceae bacterium]|nr:heme biosynthesis protein HemY [Caulobacteraceae bacterium]
LVRILAAQAAEAAGDGAAARLAYTAMLGFPEMRLAAHRGLMLADLADGDRAGALGHAQAAYALARTAPWAWRAVLDERLEAADWNAGLGLVQGALERKIITPVVAERARAALRAALAASLEPVDAAGALEHANASVKARPDFAPGAVMAARLLAAAGRLNRATQVIETAWKSRPHPALSLAYRDLVTDETPAARAGRLAALIAANPDHRESRILRIEQALLAGDAAGARAAALTLESEPLTQRLAALFARAATAAGDVDAARAWIARGAAAPQEPDWSDLDPEGKAFAYAPADWARLAATYADTGELIHPRLERRERSLGDLPRLPAHYAQSAALLGPPEAGGLPPPIVDDADFADDLAALPPATESSALPAARGARAARGGAKTH